jgi:hypothetical protein
LDTSVEIKTAAGEESQKTQLGTIPECAWKLKKRGLADNTISLRTYQLQQLHITLRNPRLDRFIPRSSVIGGINGIS